MGNWLKRRLWEPLLGLLRAGISPDRLALCVAIGVVVGNIPILGTSTVLCTVIALLFRLNQQLGISSALADLGMPEAGLDEAAELACENPYANPRQVERAAIRELLQHVWEGRAPH